MRLSIIVPTLNEASSIAVTLDTLMRARSEGAEVLVVDGGSTDATLEHARQRADRILSAPNGRAQQMNAGAAAAAGDVLWFVHADSRVDPDATADLEQAFDRRQRVWARFGVRLSGQRPLFRTIAALMNLRSCVTGIATGDQAVAVTRAAFDCVGGFPALPLMEDVALARLLRRRQRPACLPVRITTSSRRWERHGPWRTIWLMWSLRFAFWRGVDADRLARRYRGGAL
jgi:rSAM/selenodomain-associated transferase 2